MRAAFYYLIELQLIPASETNVYSPWFSMLEGSTIWGVGALAFIAVIVFLVLLPLNGLVEELAVKLGRCPMCRERHQFLWRVVNFGIPEEKQKISPSQTVCENCKMLYPPTDRKSTIFRNPSQ